MPESQTGAAIIAIGAKVHARDGEVGTVSRVIVDARDDVLTDVVVKSGTVFASERVVPLENVSGGTDEELWIDVEKDAFDEFSGFDPEHYRAPDPDYKGPPGWDSGGFNARNFQLNSVVAMGPLAAFGSPIKPLGYPGGEATGPGRIARPALTDGSPVIDADGEKIGEVSELEMSAETGQPTRLVVKQGFIFHKERELPVDWIAELSDKGVVLSVARTEVEQQD